MYSLYILTLITSIWSSVESNTYYVKPNASSSCPVESCLTWNQYSTQSSQLYFKSGVTFIFLPGNHEALYTVTLTGLSNIIFKGLNDTSRKVNINILNSHMLFFKRVTNLTISNMTFMLQSNTSSSASSVLKYENSNAMIVNNCAFQREKSFTGTFARAIYSYASIINIVNCLIVGNTGNPGGAVYAINLSKLTVTDSSFIGNRASETGGAIYLLQSSLHLTGRNGNRFVSNSAGKSGGAVYCESGIVTSTQLTVSQNQGCMTLFSNNNAIKGGALFTSDTLVRIGISKFDAHDFRNNSANDGGGIYFILDRFRLKVLNLAGHNKFDSNSVSSFKSAGGAIYIKFGNFSSTGIATFSNNKAYFGGGIYIFGTDTVLGGNAVNLEHNEAVIGAGIFVVTSIFHTTADNINFFDNKALQKGGALRLSNFGPNYIVNIKGNFFNNTASICGSALYIETGYNITLTDINVFNNHGSALCFYKSEVSFHGSRTLIVSNRGKSGGGIRSDDSSLNFFNTIHFRYNNALFGGAIFSLSGGSLTFYGDITFKGNTAAESGGAIFAFDTNTTIAGIANFTSNSARRGGGMYLNSALLNLIGDPRTTLTTSFNFAMEYGGAIYHEDSIIPSQCNFDSKYYQDFDTSLDLPLCFLQMQGVNAYGPGQYIVPAHINSYKDSSGLLGDFLYGGLLDRCRMTIHNITNDAQNSMVPYRFLVERALIIDPIINRTTDVIASRVYQLCFCETDEVFACSNTVYNINVYRGQTFRVPLLAFNQIRVIASTTVTAKLSSNSSVRYYQNSQVLPPFCSNLTYNVYSKDVYEELILYPDGPCRDSGLTRGVVQVKLRPCPDAFTLHEDRCICEDRLQAHNATCNIDDDVYITRGADSTFWMSALYDNGTYKGLILYKTCPVEYCTNRKVNITLENIDVQCSSNRVGKLCGECRANYSLTLAGTKCLKCKNTSLWLLIPFAAAGIVLVLFLTFTRFTVATGMINSIILYANIIQANKYLFGTSSITNVITVFIAWLNLDLGIPTCFFHGLDAYAQTWLQFVFPLYIWILISLIIFSSKYSITISKLIGSNPIAVLATLLLMSYAKILKIIIDVFSFVELDYPGYTVRVWLKDANVPYLQSNHLILAIITAAICMLLFLPYTFLLLLGPKLYSISGGKYYAYVLIKFKPLLDSYYAPYKKHTRYWTGFLLVVRCVLYIVFSFNSLGGATKSFMAINIVFTGLIITAWLSVSIYKHFSVNLIEAFVYLNIITLSAATLAESSSAHLVNSLVGSVLLLTFLIILYHIHHFYVAKTQAWFRFVEKIGFSVNSVKNLVMHKKNNVAAVPMRLPTNIVSQDPPQGASKSVVDIREPLLENK